MNNIVVKSNGILSFQGKDYRCALGRGGILLNKREGDGATPIGSFAMRKLYYRPDRFEQAPQTALPSQALAIDDGWSDDINLPEYNTYVKLPYAGSHEKLWREDEVYDLIIPLGYNDDQPVAGLGSAIFMHIARPTYSPTDGCIALAEDDLLELLSLVSPDTQVTITE